MSPWRSSQCGDPGLQETSEEDSRVLASDDEIEDTERGEEVYDETGDDCDHVKTELLGCHCQVRKFHDLTSYQAHDAEWWVPTEAVKVTSNCH